MMYVKNWFMDKNFTQNERYAINCTDGFSIVRETEKAALLKWDTDFGTIQRWVPKACIESEEEHNQSMQKEAERIADAENAYMALVEECRAHGIPARKGWKVETMKMRLENAQ